MLAQGTYQVDSASELIKLGQDRAKTSPIGQTAEDPGPRPRRLNSAPEDAVSHEKKRAEGHRENAIKKCTEL